MWAQERPAIITQDTLPPVNPMNWDSLIRANVAQPQTDSLVFSLSDTIPGGLADTLSGNLDRVTFSKDSLDAPVDYTAVDSMIYDIEGQKVHMFGQAQVTYTTINLTADYIMFDWATNEVIAEGRPDSVGRMAGFPQFEDGQQSFTADRMRYNFKTRKGIVYDVTTAQGDITVQGRKSKFVSTEQTVGDSTTRNDVVFSQNAIFTTCQHPEPHFGIRSTKQKVVPGKLVIVGPSNLEIMGVPTPVWLPFGFFPLAEGRRTGLLFPNDYEYSPQWGFGIRDIGWFFPLGDHFNLSVTGNIYLKGTWGLNAYSQYRKRYKYNGGLRIGYDSRRSEDSEGVVTRQNSFAFTWSHSQDAAAHPTNTLGGSINIQTNGFQSRVYNDANRVLQNQLNSNFTFAKNWQDKPISFSAAFNHSQNTQTQNVTINFPVLQFQTRALYPFRRKVRSGKERWYENITMRYKSEARNRFTATDTSLFTQQTLNDAEFGVRQDLNVGTSFKLLKYFSLNPNVTYREVWYFNSLQKEFDPTLEIVSDTIFAPDGSGDFEVVYDTIGFGTVEDIKKYGFKPFREFSAGIGMNTQIFGTVRFRGGWLRGLRHVVKPSIGLSFSPNYLSEGRGYFDYVQTDVRFPDDLDRYSIFEGNIYGSPPESGQRMALTYGLNNIFEAKYYSKKDSTEKNMKLFDNLNISGSYNFAADTLQWSQVGMSGTARFFKGITTLSMRATFDPYIENEEGRRINTTVWSVNKRLLRFVQANANFNTRITVSKIRALFENKEEEVVTDLREEAEERANRKREETDFLSLFENFSISHNLAMRLDKTDEGRDTFFVSTHAINFQGRVDLTPNWGIRVGNFGYDFVRKGISYPSVGFTRNLHCWELGLQWAPTRGTYSFYIRVKPGSLDFLNIPYERNNADAIRAFQ